MRDRNRNNDNENKEFRVRVLYLFPLVVIVKQFVHFPSSIVKKKKDKKKSCLLFGFFFSSIDWDRHGLCELESGDNRFIVRIENEPKKESMIVKRERE